MKDRDNSLPQSYVYFAFHGDDFDPINVTKELGIEPTKVWKKGDIGQFLPNQKYSYWKWSTEKGKEAIFLGNLVDEVISQLKDKIEIINKLKAEYKLKSVLVIVMHIDTNPESSTPALGHNFKTIEFLYRTQTETDVDIYRYNSAEKTK